jgi:hypothetical protein
MSSIVYRDWSWDITVENVSGVMDNVHVTYWENDSQTPVTSITDATGVITKTMTQNVNQIDNVSDITVTNKTPHIISVCKYNYEPRSVVFSFLASRVDTIILRLNNNITESDESVVSGYTGISIDHVNQEITLTENHTLAELYDYSQYDVVQNPQKLYPTGVLKTDDGDNYTLAYDLTIDGCSLSGSGYINMENDTLTMLNGGSTTINIKDINGLSVGIEITALDITDGTPIEDAMVFLEDTSNNLIIKALTDVNGKVSTTYLYTADVNVQGRVRKGTSPIFYKTATINGIITTLGFKQNIFMVRD